MEQIYVDTLNTVVIHKYDLDALVFELEAVERQNTILYIVLFLVVAAAILIGYKIVGKHKRQLEQEHLQKKLLSKQVENLPYLSESINKISNKSIRISSSLYEELQGLLNDVKSGSKNSLNEIVNDANLLARYPYIKEMGFLTPSEKLVLLLTEEGYPAKQIALYLGTSDSSVRAMKTRIRNKLSQSGSDSFDYNKLRISKKNQL